MKNKFLLLIFSIVLTQSCFSQEYPLNTSPSDVPNNAYIKDMNGELDKYIGLWKGNWNGKIVYLDLRKIKTSNNLGVNTYYKDRIYGERKVINSNGQIEIDRITNFDTVNPEFGGIGVNLVNPIQKRLLFFPKNMCGMNGAFNIINITGTTMTLHMAYIGEGIEDNCIHNAYAQQHGEYPINFPNDIVLIKQ